VLVVVVAVHPIKLKRAWAAFDAGAVPMLLIEMSPDVITERRASRGVHAGNKFL
jgi:hypothetical protein